MATRRIKVSNTETRHDVVDEVGDATNSDHFELTIDLDHIKSKRQFKVAWDKVWAHVKKSKWPMA